MLAGPLPLGHVVPHERSADRRCAPAALDDDRDELEAAVDRKESEPVLESVAPLPRAALHELLADLGGALVGVYPRRHKHPESPAVAKEVVRGLDEQLVGVDLAGTLDPVGVLPMR